MADRENDREHRRRQDDRETTQGWYERADYDTRRANPPRRTSDDPRAQRAGGPNRRQSREENDRTGFYSRSYRRSTLYGEGFGHGDRPRPDYDRETFDEETPDWAQPGPYTGQGPRGYQRSDDRIYEDACERLTRHGRIDASNIEVKVEGGEIYLTGEVDSRETKRLAEMALDSVPGIYDIHNKLIVRREGMQRRQGGMDQQS